MKKRLFSILLAVCLAVCAFSVTALADATTHEVANKAELDTAIAAAQDGDTIKLTADINYGNAQLKIEKAITLDLGGKTLTNSFGYGGLSLKGNCSVINGTIDHQGGVAAIKAWNVEKLENLTITVAARPGKTVGGIVIQEGSTVRIGSIKYVTINGEGLTNGIETYNCGNATEPVIGSMEDVTIDATGTGMLISAPCGKATNCDIKGSVSGIEIWIKGTYSASLDLVNCEVEGGEQAVYAHDEFNSGSITNIGKIVLTADDGTEFNSDNGVPLTLTIARVNEDTQVDLPEKLTENLVAKANGTYFGSLADAVAAANAIEGGATVELLKNVTLGEKLSITGNVTIFGEKTITRDDTYTGTLFEVAASATLTLDGGLTIDGSNEWVMDMTAYEADRKAFTKVDDGSKYFTSEEGAPVATAHMITISGTDAVLNLNEVTIKNHYANSEKVIVSADTGATVNLNGAKITHNAITSGSGLVVNASSGKWDTTPVIWVNMNEGTVIDGNHVGGNHGIFKVYMGTVFTMNGGSIKNTTGWNSNGVAVGVYWATFNMNGGEICTNSGVYGPNNGRCAPVYLHSAHIYNMTGGSICHNAGGSRSGLDAPYADSTSNGVATITGGYIGENTSYYNDNGFEGYNPDITAGDKLIISGGTFAQDVSEWCVPGYKADDSDGDGIWRIVEDPDQYVVEMDGVKYLTIKDALWTLKSADTETHTLTVLKDHEIDVNNSTYNYPILVNGFSVVLDLNGKTITADWSKYTGSRVDNALIGVCNGGKLTVVDSVGSGKIVNNDTKENVENRIFWIMTSTETKSIEVNIEGGTFVQNDVNTALLYVQGNKPSDNLAPMYINIKDGHFETVDDDFFNAYDNYQHTSLIYGGTFNKNPTDWEIKIADGYMAIENDDGIWAVARKECVVTFDSNGGSAVDAQTIVYREDAELQKASKPDDPIKSGYTFLGWYLNDEEYDFDTAVTDSITLIAKWEKNSVYIPVAPVKPVQKDEPCDGGKDCPAFLLSDVDTDAWYHEAIDFALTEGLMNGVGGGKFNPGGNFTRAMMWTVLARQAGVDTDGGETWYSVAQEWAIANDVSDGTNPNGAITREQLVTMLWRYVGEPEGKADLSDFVDGDDVSEWAEEAMRWAVAVKVISGRGSGILAPQGLATRAEVAQIFKNYFE